MKKIITIIFTLTICFTIAACGSNSRPDNSESSTSDSASDITNATDEIIEANETDAIDFYEVNRNAKKEFSDAMKEVAEMDEDVTNSFWDATVKVTNDSITLVKIQSDEIDSELSTTIYAAMCSCVAKQVDFDFNVIPDTPNGSNDRIKWDLSGVGGTIIFTISRK